MDDNSKVSFVSRIREQMLSTEHAVWGLSALLVFPFFLGISEICLIITFSMLIITLVVTFISICQQTSKTDKQKVPIKPVGLESLVWGGFWLIFFLGLWGIHSSVDDFTNYQEVGLATVKQLLSVEDIQSLQQPVSFGEKDFLDRLTNKNKIERKLREEEIQYLEKEHKFVRETFLESEWWWSRGWILLLIYTGLCIALSFVFLRNQEKKNWLDRQTLSELPPLIRRVIQRQMKDDARQKEFRVGTTLNGACFSCGYHGKMLHHKIELPGTIIANSLFPAIFLYAIFVYGLDGIDYFTELITANPSILALAACNKFVVTLVEFFVYMGGMIIYAAIIFQTLIALYEGVFLLLWNAGDIECPVCRITMKKRHWQNSMELASRNILYQEHPVTSFWGRHLFAAVILLYLGPALSEIN